MDFQLTRPLTHTWVETRGKAEPIYPTEETHLSYLYPQPHPFSHDPQLTTIDDSWNIDELVNRKLCPSATPPSSATPALPLTAHQTACPLPAPAPCHWWTNQILKLCKLLYKNILNMINLNRKRYCTLQSKICSILSRIEMLRTWVLIYSN